MWIPTTLVKKFLKRSRRRVVVTGVGLVTCLGVGRTHVWNRLLDGECGLTSVTYSGHENIPCKVAGHVPMGNNSGELNLDLHLTPSEQRVMSPASSFAVAAAEEAVSDAGWKPTELHNRLRTGVAVGMGMPGLHHIATVGRKLREKGYKKLEPHLIPYILINMAAGHISLKYHFQGPNHAVSTACSTGLHAIGDASRFIQHGDADVMVAGGTEASCDVMSIAGFARMRALSTKFNETPEQSSRPFDKDRDGFVMSEGAGVVVLEELSHALKRGAKIYAEVLGYGLSGDAHHITTPSEDGDGAYRCMEAALRDAGLEPGDVGYINAHATSTPLGDLAESRAIWNLFKSHRDTLMVSSTKGATGHLLGAAGSVEAIVAILACQSGKAPPTINLHSPDTGVDLNYIPNKSADWSSLKRGKRIALTNSFGFGGTNGCLCFGRFRD